MQYPRFIVPCFIGAALAAGAVARADVAPHEIVAVAAEIGLTPHSLVVAGMSASNDAVAVLERLALAEQERDAFSAARSTVDATGAEVAEFSAAILLDPDDLDLQADHANAVALHDQALASLSTARDALLDAALDGVASQVVQNLQIWRATVGFAVDPEFRSVARPDEQWRLLAAALRAEQRAQRTGESLATEHAQLLSETRSELAVIEAQNALATYLSAIAQAFDNYANGE